MLCAHLHSIWNLYPAETGWSLLESDDGSKTLVPSPTKSEIKEEPQDGTIELMSQPICNTEEKQMARIGSEVETISGKSGILICSSGMGLSPMDLFNDILTERNDLENFLGDCNFKESDSISLRTVFTKYQTGNQIKFDSSLNGP